jgi:hypothetical protein
MQATETTLMDVLVSPVRLIIPLYHRYYRWSSRQWRGFWEDVLRAGRRESGCCFMGMVFTCEKDEHRTEVVDGMHRLVTAALLIAALRRALTPDEEGPLPSLPFPEFKLDKFQLKGADDGTLRRIIEGQPKTAECSRRMFEAYHYFLGRARNLDEAGRSEICRGLTGLTVLWVALSNETDAPQAIYFSQNS